MSSGGGIPVGSAKGCIVLESTWRGVPVPSVMYIVIACSEFFIKVARNFAVDRLIFMVVGGTKSNASPMTS